MQPHTHIGYAVFQDFDPALFEDPNFKEDSVREVVIAPILRRLGYTPSGDHQVVRSKALKHPFIYAGTRRLPVTLIPDYTLYSNGRALLVLDAKQPRINILDRESVQQAYSYAIHPEVKAPHFALCNGKRIVLFDVDNADPIYSIDYKEFESKWSEIERYLSPRTLSNPLLRRYAPDFGCAISRLGLKEGAAVTLLPASFNFVSRLSDSALTASANVDFADRPHCVSFDFERGVLPEVLACLPSELAEAFTDALNRAPFQAAAELAIELDLETELGPEVQVETETFRPLIVKKVLASRFNPAPLSTEPTDIPSYVFRLRKAFALKDRPNE